MNIKKDKLEEFVAWIKHMNSVKKVTTISFFNALCLAGEKGFDIVVVISNILVSPECDRPYCIADDDVYLAMCAFGDFHEMGADFRKQWNMGQVTTGYSKYIEEGNIKHIAQPFAYNSIFESDLFIDEDDEGRDGDDGWNGQ